MSAICKFMLETDNGGGEYLYWNDSSGTDTALDNMDLAHVQVSKLNRITYMVIAPVIITVGIIGDLLTVITLTHPALKRKKHIYTFLTFLAVTDLLTHLSVIPPILWILDIRLCNRWAALYYAHIAFPLANALMGASVWVIVLLTLYQFKAVCYPLHSSCRQNERRFIYLLFGLVYICNFCVYAPWSQKKTVYQLNNEHSLFESVPCPFLVCDRKMNTPFFLVYEWLRECLTRLFPFLLIAYFNVNILITYKNNRKDRLNLSSQSFHKRAVVEKSEKEERRLFTLLFGITIIFFLCTIPAAPLTILISDRQSHSLPFQAYRSMANVLEITKFALNFYFYCLINPDIRRVCIQLLKCHWLFFPSQSASAMSFNTTTSLPNSRTGSNKTLLTTRDSGRSSKGSRRNSLLPLEKDNIELPLTRQNSAISYKSICSDAHFHCQF